MRRFPTWSPLLILAACQAQISDAPLAPLDAAVEPDARIVVDVDAAPIDAPPAVLGAWSTPVKIDVASSAAGEDDVTLSSNTLELFFAINGANGKDLFHTSRLTTADAWTPPVRLSFNDATESDETPRLSADDLTLYFASGRDTGRLDIYQATRDAPGSLAWSTPVPVTAVNTGLNEKWFMPCGSAHYVLVRDATGNGTNLFEGDLGGSPPVSIATLNEPTGTTTNETGTFVAPDCLTIHFASNRVTPGKMFRAQRATITDPWPAPIAISDFPIAGGDGNQEDPWLSSDERTFAFASDAAGSKDLYLSTRAPVTDLR